MKNSSKISKINIRATSIEDFWGCEFYDSLYLWEGAKHELTLKEIENEKNVRINTFEDLFEKKDKITEAHNDCQKLYFKLLPLITKNLNEIHHLNLPVSFWRTAFGYWLFRHICIVYEKYSYLSKLDIDKTSIKLLDKKSFFIPNDHYEYVNCFCNDFGVQQLVSHYYYLFKDKEFPIRKKIYKLNADVKIAKESAFKKRFSIKRYLSLAKTLFLKVLLGILPRLIKPKIVLVNSFYSNEVKKQLLIGSRGLIQSIYLPKVKISQNKINSLKRERLIDINSDNELEYFLIKTLYYCIPRIFMEQFLNYYDVYLEDIQKRDFRQIVSEGWIGKNSDSIYCAIAQYNGKIFTHQDHGIFGTIYKSNYLWYELLSSDRLLTKGWKNNHPKIIQGGFSCRANKQYDFRHIENRILFISHSRFPYLMEYAVNSESNSHYIKFLKNVDEFINILPVNLIEQFILRPRTGKDIWDIEDALAVKRRNIKIDKGNFSNSINKSKIIIIDHLSTGVAEILLMGAPFLLIFQPHGEIYGNYEKIFEELSNCGVVQNSAQSAIEQLIEVYDNVESWWNSEAVQTSINKLKSSFLAPPSKTLDFLLTCLNE